MQLTHSLTAALGLLLLAPNGALAHTGHPRNVTLEYHAPATKTIRVTFTNTTSDLDKAAVNLCEAKDTLPSDWQDGPPAPLSTAKQCKKAPLFPVAHDGDFGDIAFNIPQGKYTYTTPPPEGSMPVEPGDYVVSVALYSDELADRDDHHDDGVHMTLKRLTLTLPDNDGE